MRHLIERVSVYRSFFGLLFNGSPEPRLKIDKIAGTPFSDFDSARKNGNYVFECEINLRNALYTRSQDVFDEAVTVLAHERAYDGVVFTQNKERIVVVFDPDRVSVLDRHDAACDLDMPLDETGVVLREFSPAEGQNLLLVTGQLAKTGLSRVMQALGDIPFSYEIRALDVAVAAWLTTDRIGDEIGDLEGFDVVVIPGKATGDEAHLQARLGVAVMRGPSCYSEIPLFFEREGMEIDLEGNIRPKIVVVGDPKHAQLLAGTYEVPLIDPETLSEELDEPFEAVPHNVLAEVVRAHLITQRKGYVLHGYPRTARDAAWLTEITSPDVILVIGEGGEIAGALRDNPALVHLRDPDASEIMTRVETLLQACVIKT